VRRTGRGRLTQENLPQSFALVLVGPFVNNGLLGTVALPDLAGPIQEQRPVEAVELGFVEGTFLDVACYHRLAVTMRCGRAELARAAPVAVAVPILNAADHPLIGNDSSLPGLAGAVLVRAGDAGCSESSGPGLQRHCSRGSP
jgi:hypothetical protein